MPVREVQVDQGAEVAASCDVLKLLFREPHGHGFYCNAIAGTAFYNYMYITTCTTGTYSCILVVLVVGSTCNARV